jgi:hypothetical protein
MVTRAVLGILILQAILTGVLSLFFGIDSLQNFIGLAVGSFVSGFNFLILIVFYVLVFIKKRVALGISIVVIKYAILGLLLWYFLTQTNLRQGAFLGGIVSNPLAIVVYALAMAKVLGSNRDKEG